MPNKILTLFASHGQPYTSKDIDFVQNQTFDQVRSDIISRIILKFGSYDQTRVYILYNCTDSIFGGSHHISDGVVFCNGNLFGVSNSVFPVTGDPIIANLLTRFDLSIDPTTFEDGFSGNIHQITEITFTTGTSGTGTFNGFGASTNNNLSEFYNLSSNNFSSAGLVIQPGWSNSGAPLYDVAYQLSENKCFLCGSLHNPGSPTGLTPLLQLPFNPSSYLDIICPVSDSAGVFYDAQLSITTTGLIYIDIISAPTGTFVLLDNISFRVL